MRRLERNLTTTAAGMPVFCIAPLATMPGVRIVTLIGSTSTWSAARFSKPCHLSFGLSTLPHWIVCVSDKSTPAKLDSDSGNVHFAVLVGITEAEMQCAMRVRPELADGRKVLFEALRRGQVYPITDPDRTCMTRRRDFHRIWEAAFQHVKNAKG